jgi:glutamine amidotransferase/cyclase
MPNQTITVLDHGIGNIRSVINALDFCGYKVNLVGEGGNIRSGDLVILPGVGNFGGVMNAIKSKGFYEEVKDYIFDNQPLLGICVGMQVLFQASEEAPQTPGFEFFDGHLEHISKLEPTKSTPSIGWHDLTYKNQNSVASGLTEAYFVHNYFASGVRSEELLSTYAWHGHSIPAHVSRGKIHGVQFHPEKSRLQGLKFLSGLISEILH